MMHTLFDFGTIVLADLVLSGDNALIIGMAAAALAPELRKKAIFYGMLVAAVLRIIFALLATKLLAVPGLLLAGSLMLFWVCWRLFWEIRESHENEAANALQKAENPDEGYTGKPRRTLAQALISITIADVSMSIDNVLAVAAIANGNEEMLFFGLILAIVLMAFCATIVMKMLTRFPWISWAGLIILIYVACEMMYRGIFNSETGILSIMGYSMQ